MSSNSDEYSETLDKNNFSVIGHILKHVLKNGIRDLTRVPLPTFILEKRSLLEMFADFIAYPILFSTIGDPPSAEERMISVCRWFFSSVSVRRGVKKPYNPIIGETFRCKWDMTSHKCGTLMYLAEQVSHHPPVSAFHVENRAKNIIFNSHIHTKSQFIPPNSAGVGMIGRGCITLLGLGEDYIFTYPSAYARGIFFGTMQFEMGDTVRFECPQTGYTAEIEFKVKPTLWGEYHCITGQIYDPDNNSIYTMSGKWTTGVYIKDERTGNSEILFSKEKYILNDQPTKILVDFEDMGDFESRKLWIEVTRALNEGDIDKATKAKAILEDRQRAEENERNEKNLIWQPRYFTYYPDIGNGSWIFNDTVKEKLSEDPSLPVSPSKDILTWDWKIPTRDLQVKKADGSSAPIDNGPPSVSLNEVIKQEELENNLEEIDNNEAD